MYLHPQGNLVERRWRGRRSICEKAFDYVLKTAQIQHHFLSRSSVVRVYRCNCAISVTYMHDRVFRVNANNRIQCQRVHWRDPWFQEERRIQEITRVRKGCELAVIILNTKATPNPHYPISISSPTLNSHCVIALALIITSLFRDRMKLTKRKGRAQWPGEGCESQHCWES